MCPTRRVVGLSNLYRNYLRSVLIQTPLGLGEWGRSEVPLWCWTFWGLGVGDVSRCSCTLQVRRLTVFRGLRPGWGGSCRPLRLPRLRESVLSLPLTPSLRFSGVHRLRPRTAGVVHFAPTTTVFVSAGVRLRCDGERRGPVDSSRGRRTVLSLSLSSRPKTQYAHDGPVLC